MSGVVVGGAHGAGGDGPGGEHHRLPEGPSGPESGYKQMMPLERNLWQCQYTRRLILMHRATLIRPCSPPDL